MSKRRKQKRDASAWNCLGCGMPMHQQLAGPAQQAAEARVPGRRIELTHICGQCGALHMEGADGRLRPPTAGERFDIEMQCGEYLGRGIGSEPMRQPTATMILPPGVEP